MGLTKVFASLILIGLLWLTPQTSQSQVTPTNGRSFGIGLMLGEPTGISVKSWNGERSAFSIGAAWSLAGRNEALHLHGDILLHSWFREADAGRLAFYYGLGGRFLFTGDASAGIRLPLGLNYVFRSIPLDLFAEAVPIFDFTPNTEFAGNGAIGFRYYI